MKRRHFWVLEAQKTVIYLTVFIMSLFNAQAQLGTPPIIDVQPLGIAVLEGGIAEFTVTVSLSTVLTSPTFKWRRDGQEIGSGLTLASVNSLIINNVRAGDAGTYNVEVRNAAGTVVSSNAVLLVLLEPVVQTVNVLVSGLTTNGFRLQLSGPVGSNLVIQASTDLSNWSSISTNAATDGTVDFTDTTALNRPHRFYRAYVQ